MAGVIRRLDKDTLKKQIINNTVVVAVVVVVAAVLIMVLDAVFGFGLNQLLKGV